MEQPYISPYLDVIHLDLASTKMEKRIVVVVHEVLSLCVLKRMTFPILGNIVMTSDSQMHFQKYL